MSLEILSIPVSMRDYPMRIFDFVMTLIETVCDSREIVTMQQTFG